MILVNIYPALIHIGKEFIEATFSLFANHMPVSDDTSQQPSDLILDTDEFNRKLEELGDDPELSSSLTDFPKLSINIFKYKKNIIWALIVSELL